MNRFSLFTVVIVAVVCSNLSAQTKIDLQPGDTVLSILQRNIGQTVDLRLNYDAVVDTVEVSAVVVRRGK